MNEPLLSVVMPVLNGEKFLREALRSIRAPARSIEVILVNDGSTDGTSAIARGVDDPPVIYMEQFPTAGPAVARNRGLEAARGKYIGFLDVDDLWTGSHPEKALEYLAAHPEVDLVLGQIQCLLPKGSTGEFAPSGRIFHSFQLGAAIARRTLFDRVGGFDSGMRYGEDVDWFLRVRESGASIATLPVLSLYYRLHSGNQPLVYESSRVGLLNAFHQSLQRRRGNAVPNESRPLISVIIPAHDAERFIAEAIDSVVAQDYRPIELIVVDDGSTDNTRRTVRQFPEATLLEQDRAGAGAARNAGVRASRGKFLAFLDADDLWEPGKLASQMEMFVADPKLEAAFGQSIEFGEEREQSEAKPAPIPGTMLIRREAFERIGFYTAEPAAAEGIDWFLRAQEKSLRFQISPKIFYRRRIHSHNRTRTEADDARYLRAIKAALDRRRAGAV
jgi:glycosyltransferase involved in cell wall biosynthesis